MISTIEKTPCYHCGEDCLDDKIGLNDKNFCCNGCKTVFEILDGSKLGDYYKIENSPGINPVKISSNKYEYLDEDSVQNKLLQYKDENISVITFYIPEIHCTSCIWLLENLFKLNDYVQSSRVNFLRKELKVSFKHNELSLRELVELLHSIGYNPKINLDQTEEKKSNRIEKKLIFRLGVAGFCFGNIMLLSLPEYFGLDVISKSNFSHFFGYLNILLSLPVLIYSAREYFRSALIGLTQNRLNIDVPISLGIIALFLRSVYEIISQSGTGYLDSLVGLIFFLLLGKVFQQKTYNTLSFERDYKSYFPIAVTKVRNDGTEKNVPVIELVEGDEIIVRNNEIIPVDTMLLSEQARIDSSFVTGESNIVEKVKGDTIFAGCKQKGNSISLKVTKTLSQSYLTQLWNDEAFTKEKENRYESLTNNMSKYFTLAILLIATGGFIFWSFSNIGVAFNSFTSVLIIACPCALALSAPFTFGNALRIYGRNKLFLKNAAVIERLAKARIVIFDKTGTITQPIDGNIEYKGKLLDKEERDMLYTLLRESNHPLSKMLATEIDGKRKFEIENFNETVGKGISAIINGFNLKVGSASFVEADKTVGEPASSQVYIKINEDIKGFYKIQSVYRKNLRNTLMGLKDNFDIKLLSGDNDAERENLVTFFDPKTEMLFNQTPDDKLKYVRSLQKDGTEIIMIGDGLNDAGALQQADIGISVSEDVNTFSPACDAILDAKQFSKIPDYLNYSRSCTKIVVISFIISFLYNIIGLFFAIQGLLSPLTAAVLMPLSSITVVLFVTLATSLKAYQLNL